ncbi:MAG TPA: S41 family peptidase [Rubrobacteraceae bacterium]|nr:S41 family peptidase [Rubrobacteraceae bacterium]
MWKSTAKDRRSLGAGARILLFVALLLGTALGAYVYGRSQSPATLGEEDRESLALYAEALDIVSDDYVDQGAVDPEKQTYGAIEGMLETLGDEGHTRFLTPNEREANQRQTSGTYVGIGVTLRDDEDRVVVAAPIEGSPAERAGMKAGDVVVAVNGKDVREDELSEVVDKIRGPEGSRVELTVLRDGEERTFDLERAEVDSPVASWAMIPGTAVAHVRLSSFSRDSADELREALSKAREAGATRFVLDLRNNTGGLVGQTVEVAGQFLDPGSLVYIREEASGEREEITVSRDAAPMDEPVAVLVNEGSASGAEILAGALRDNDRALLIGETTFGTGTTLQEFALDDGSAILLGVAEWLTPSGDFIRGSGIEPDIEVRMGEGDELLTPNRDRGLSREEILERDPQLRRAFEELRE